MSEETVLSNMPAGGRLVYEWDEVDPPSAVRVCVPETHTPDEVAAFLRAIALMIQYGHISGVREIPVEGPRAA